MKPLLRFAAIVVAAGLACARPAQDAGTINSALREQHITAARSDLAAHLGIASEEVEMVEFETLVWPDSSLGCPEPGMMYAQATQEGYRILLRARGEEFAYHGAAGEEPFMCRPGLENGSFMVDLDGFEIHVEVHGRGPAVMTLPNSWGLSLEGLRALYRPLEEKLTMVYFDPRGMGGSAPIRDESDMSMAAVRADFDALRRHLGLDRVHAIGWSNGAVNLIHLAAESPGTLSSAIFVHGVASYTQQDAAQFADRYPDLMARYVAFQQEMADETIPVDEKTDRMRSLWLEEFFPLMTADPDSAGGLLARVFGDAQFSWPHAEYADRETSVFDARDRLAGIPVRSLVIAGAYDLSPPAKVQELHDGLPDSGFVVFDDSGHFAPVEETESFKSTVFDFLGVE